MIKSETKSFPLLSKQGFHQWPLGLFPTFTAENCIPLGQLLGLAEAIDRYSNITGEADAEARKRLFRAAGTGGKRSIGTSCDSGKSPSRDY